MVLFFPFAIPSEKAQTSNKQPTICDLQGLDCYAEGLAAGSAPALAPAMRGYMNWAVEAMAQTVGAVRAEERGSTALAARSRRTLFGGRNGLSRGTQPGGQG